MNAKSQELLSMKWLDATVDPIEYLIDKAKGFCEIMNQEMSGISAWKILLGVCTFFISVNTSIIGYLVVNQVSISNNMVGMEGRTMSTVKGDALLNKMNEIDLKVAAIPKENPPAWVLENIKRNEDRIEKLEAKVEAYRKG